jgi:hypothetical protein
LRSAVLNSRFGDSAKVRQLADSIVVTAQARLGWLAITESYGAFRYAVEARGARQTIVVIHEACGAHEENLGPEGRDLWDQVVKRNGLHIVEKLKRLPEGALIKRWNVWFISFSTRSILAYDQNLKVWYELTVEDLEQILGAPVKLDSITQAFDRIWQVTPTYKCDHAHDHSRHQCDHAH